MKAMILAAGRGQRLRPLTDVTPKPLLAVHGKPLIVHHLIRLQLAGFREVVINTSWLADKIENFLEDGSRYGLQIQYSREPEGALDTGGGIMNALPLLGGKPFLVVNGDIYTDFPFECLKQKLRDGDLAHLVMVGNPLLHHEGDFHLTADGRLHADREPRLTYSGIGVHDPKLFQYCSLGKFPMLPFWQQAMQTGCVSGQKYEGMWKDIGTIEGLHGLS